MTSILHYSFCFHIVDTKLLNTVKNIFKNVAMMSFQTVGKKTDGQDAHKTKKNYTYETVWV